MRQVMTVAMAGVVLLGASTATARVGDEPNWSWLRQEERNVHLEAARRAVAVAEADGFCGKADACPHNPLRQDAIEVVHRKHGGRQQEPGNEGHKAHPRTLDLAGFASNCRNADN